MIPRQARAASPVFNPASRIPPRHAPADVSLTIRIESLDALNLRLALHRALGARIGVYVLAVDHQHGQTAVQLQCARDQVDAIMHAVMSGLPRAEFGPVLLAGSARRH